MNLQSYVTIGDPRHILRDGVYCDFLQVLKANDVNANPNQDLFTASISQHEGYLLSGKDNLKDTLDEVKLVDQEGANDDSEMDEGGNSSQKDEDEDMNED
jgi:hypothetical protein